MKSKKIFVSVCSNIGNAKSVNEDNFVVNNLFNEHSFDFSKHNLKVSIPCVAGVFDGISGLSKGEYASKTAAKMAQILYGKIRVTLDAEYELKSFYDSANRILCKIQRDNNIAFGTTAAIVIVKDNEIIFSNLGDSKIYLISDGVIKQVSKDHNEAGFLLDAGLITTEQAKNHPMKNILCQYLGDTDLNFIPQPHISLCKRYSGKEYAVVICSDGVSDTLTDDQILQLVKCKTSNNAENLVKLSMQNGARDNSTAIVMYIS